MGLPKVKKTKDYNTASALFNRLFYPLLTSIILIVIVLALFIYKSDPKEYVTKQESHETIAVPEDNEADEEPLADSATPWFLITLLTLSTGANGCIAAFIFLYNRKRLELLKDKKFVEPETLQQTLQSFVSSVNKIGKELEQIKVINHNTVAQIVQQTQSVLKEIEIQSKGHGEGIDKMMDTFLTLNNKIDEKDAEIKRYKEGYDTENIKASLAGYIKVRDRIKSYVDNEKTSLQDLDKLLIIVESAIDNLGASEIEIEIGDKFFDDKYVGLIDNPEVIETDDLEKDGTIASVVRKGYEIKGQERNTTIRNAKVTIYKNKHKDN